MTRTGEEGKEGRQGAGEGCRKGDRAGGIPGLGGGAGRGQAAATGKEERQRKETNKQAEADDVINNVCLFWWH